jgi:hypothetical protein
MHRAVTVLAWVGVSLLIVCVVAIVVEGAMVAIWTWRLTKRARLLQERLATERIVLKSELDQMQAELAATAVLWMPYRRALRWIRHPLAIALLQSYARRRSGAR